MKKLQIISILSLLGVSLAAQAADSYAFLGTGLYRPSNLPALTTNNGAVLSVTAGTNVSEYFGVEAAYTYLDSTDSTTLGPLATITTPAGPFTYQPYPVYTTQGYSLSVSGVGYLPLCGGCNISALGKLGIAHTQLRFATSQQAAMPADVSKTALTYGVGVQYHAGKALFRMLVDRADVGTFKATTGQVQYGFQF